MKILKIGGSFLTNKSGYREPDPKNILTAAKTVATVWKGGIRDFILVHGAGSFGHALVLKYKIDDGITSSAQKLGYADTHASCTELSLLFVETLIKEGVPAVSIPPALILEQKNKRIARFDLKLVHDYLSSGYLPVLHGDMVPDSILGGSVCSGDQIVAYLGKGADFIVLATNVDGVLDEKCQVIEKITSANFASVSKHFQITGNDVTGGMEGKIKELLALDTTSYIANAANPERIKALMSGKKAICTEVRK